MTKTTIVVNDNRMARPGQNHTGGCYSHTRIFREVEPDTWEVEHRITTEELNQILETADQTVGMSWEEVWEI